MQSPNRTGAFIVGESESQQDLYSLSILERPESYRGSVKHYRISRLQNGWFYISQRLNLLLAARTWCCTIPRLCCTLEEPCFILGSDIITSSSSSSTTQMPVTIRRPSISWKDMSRSMLFRGNRVESEHSLVSEGLREAISSYLYMTDGNEQEIG
ncbi:hypothetical protein CRUP_028539 [Coryphaenoides rupestris]|nr:hypothetical protein CRUP_028539 [Coryphaenoides rupestris]